MGHFVSSLGLLGYRGLLFWATWLSRLAFEMEAEARKSSWVPDIGWDHVSSEAAMLPSRQMVVDIFVYIYISLRNYQCQYI